MERPTLIADFSNGRDAAIAEGMLKSYGIETYVVDDAMSTLYGAGATWAPVRLYVPEAEAARAAELLRSHADM